MPLSENSTTSEDYLVSLTSLLAEELRDVLSRLGRNGLSLILEEALASDRRVLDSCAVSLKSIHLLPMLVCHSISGDFSKALPVAATMQLMLIAGDIFDDAEDNDSQCSITASYGQGLAVNGASASLILAEKTLLRLKKHNIPDDVCLKAMDILNDYFIRACIGQHKDIKAAHNTKITESIYLKTIGWKSASQFECACHLGALVSGAKRKVLNEFIRFGYFLGMSFQMANDIAGVIDLKDIKARNMTLPMIYALKNTNKDISTKINQWLESEVTPTNENKKIYNLLSDSGALYYTILKKQHFLDQAEQALKAINNYEVDVSLLESLFTEKAE